VSLVPRALPTCVGLLALLGLSATACNPHPGTPADANAIAYVCTRGYADDPGTTITAVDLTSGVVLQTVSTGTLPDALAATPDGKEILVVDQGVDQVNELSTRANRVLRSTTTGLEPDALGVTPDDTRALIANQGAGTVTPVALPSLRAGTPITVGQAPDAVGIGGPGGHTALVANFAEGTLTPINLEDDTPGSAIPAGPEPDAIAVSPDGNVAVVANLGNDTLTTINLDTLSEGPSLPLGVDPTGVEFAPEQPGTSGAPLVAWVSGGDALVQVTVLTSGPGAAPVATLRSSITLPSLAESVALTPNGTTAWVAGQDGWLRAVNLPSGTPGKRVKIGGKPSAVVIPPRG
jgi:hypothetical protein